MVEDKSHLFTSRQENSDEFSGFACMWVSLLQLWRSRLLGIVFLVGGLFSTLSMASHSPLACRVFAKFTDILRVTSETQCFSLLLKKYSCLIFDSSARCFSEEIQVQCI
jgi:hypothetical protein